MNTSWIHTMRLALARTGAAALLVAASGSAALAGSPGDPFVHDQRQMAIDGTWRTSTSQSFIGGLAAWEDMVGFQHGDDFTLSSSLGTQITNVTVDFHTRGSSSGVTPWADPTDGWLVEIFADDGGKPVETPTHQIWGLMGSNLGPFVPEGNHTEDNVATIAIDLSGEGVVLGAGVWWLSVVAVDTTPFGLEYWWAARRGSEWEHGAVAHRRHGAEAHDMDYGLPNVGNPQDPFWSAPSSSLRPHELSFRVDGFIIPAPSATLALLGAGLCIGVRRRRVSASS